MIEVFLHSAFFCAGRTVYQRDGYGSVGVVLSADDFGLGGVCLDGSFSLTTHKTCVTIGNNMDTMEEDWFTGKCLVYDKRTDVSYGCYNGVKKAPLLI